MKVLLFVLAALLVVVAVIYFVLPADSLPSFLPGHEQGLTRIRLKHGVVSGVAGVLLFLIGWYVGRAKAG